MASRDISRRFSSRKAPIPLRLAVWLAICACAGCKSGSGSGEAGDPLEVRGNTPGQISVVAAKVFNQNGYTVARMEPKRLVFEKQGSRLNDLAYGSWVDDTPVWVRVKVSIVQVSEAKCRLEYQAFWVRDKGNLLEEEVKMSSHQAGSYRKLLKQAVEQLKAPQGPSGQS